MGVLGHRLGLGDHRLPGLLAFVVRLRGQLPLVAHLHRHVIDILRGSLVLAPVDVAEVTAAYEIRHLVFDLVVGDQPIGSEDGPLEVCLGRGAVVLVVLDQLADGGEAEHVARLGVAVLLAPLPPLLLLLHRHGEHPGAVLVAERQMRQLLLFVQDADDDLGGPSSVVRDPHQEIMRLLEQVLQVLPRPETVEVLLLF